MHDSISPPASATSGRRIPRKDRSSVLDSYSRLASEAQVCVKGGLYVSVQLRMAQIDVWAQNQTRLELVRNIYGDHHGLFSQRPLKKRQNATGSLLRQRTDLFRNLDAAQSEPRSGLA